MRLIYPLLGLMMLAACSSSSRSVPDNAGRCEEPRSQVCTRDYRPVCGVQANSLAKTYGNGCTACSDGQVVYFIEGACTGKKPK